MSEAFEAMKVKGATANQDLFEAFVILGFAMRQEVDAAMKVSFVFQKTAFAVKAVI